MDEAEKVKVIQQGRACEQSYSAISKEHGLDRRYIARVCQEHGIAVDVSDANWQAAKQRGEKQQQYHICEYCGETFPTHKGRNTNRYCRMECYCKHNAEQRKWNKEHLIGKYRKIDIKNCQECNIIFCARDGNTFCSEECRYKYGLRRTREIYHYKPPHVNECEICGKISESKWPRKYCERCAYKIRKSSSIRTEEIYEKTYKRDKGYCKICGKKVKHKYNPNDLLSGTIDHIIAKVNGGSDNMDNLQLAHAICNSRKSNTKSWIQQSIVKGGIDPVRTA